MNKDQETIILALGSSDHSESCSSSCWCPTSYYFQCSESDGRRLQLRPVAYAVCKQKENKIFSKRKQKCKLNCCHYHTYHTVKFLILLMEANEVKNHSLEIVDVELSLKLV